MADKKNIAIITGATRGLGEAFFDKFVELDEFDLIVSISRVPAVLYGDHLTRDDGRRLYISVELSKLTDTKPLEILENYTKTAEKVIFISNAGVIYPIHSVGKLDLKPLYHAIQTNVTAPTLIINYLMSIFKDINLTIINISSGAANKPIDGWSLYCSAKAYMDMFIRSINQQEKYNPFIKAVSVDPGVMDTDMQRIIRTSDCSGFTNYSDFVRLKNHGHLQEPSDVAEKILSEMDII